MHPLLSHFPLVLIPATIVFDIVALSMDGGNNTLVQVAFYSLIAGIAFAVLSSTFGVIDYLWELPQRSRVREIGKIHASGMSIALVLAISSAVFRGMDLAATTPQIGAVATTIIASLVIIPMGWLGGRMVFKYGTRVEVASHGGRVWASHAPDGDDDPADPNLDLPPNVKRFPSHKIGRGKKGKKK